MTIQFNAKTRVLQGTSASRRLRRAGSVPAIVYGSGAPAQIEVDHNEIFHALRNEAFHASVLDLAIGAETAQVLLRDYQKHRVCTLLDPSKDPLGKGFHTLQGMIAIGSGGIEGKGFMKGSQTHLEFIPERTTDFIFAVYAEEFGLAGNLLLLVLYLLVIARSLMITAKATTLFGRLMGGSITLSFFTYAFVNMGMVAGILPVVGVPLPFISYGGTAMVTLGLGLGILMSVAKSRRLVQS